jgi:antitoxin YefM
MSIVSLADVRENLAALCDEVLSSREEVIIQRPGHPDVALVPAEELSSLRETAYLLRSPKNAERLLEALARARKGEGTAMTVDELRERVGIRDETDC